ncbi:hypothetical protein FC46_GL001029 [Lactobacillus kalixensis DSM 16043]|uniref:Uncharacterized protein n=2 Tax=Lactobacillus kalixensis TaxID=227944 RepID=A0A0R1UD12_9LACO|nr:hypothetical protein FC46_GL001029 [Lactobacillus kalixensis DSM 16043]
MRKNTGENYLMKIVKVTEEKERELIAAVAENNEEALLELFELHKPIVEHSKKMYWMRSFDSQDWDQEALISCHEAALRYEHSRGRFGTFYKRQLHNKAISFLRHSRAKTRVANEQAISLEKLTEDSDIEINKDNMEEICIIDYWQGNKFFSELTLLELTAFKVLIGELTYKDAKQFFNYSEVQLKRAANRVQQKFDRTLLIV